MTSLSTAEKDRLLLRVAQDHAMTVRMEILRRLRDEATPAITAPPRRSVTDLLDGAARRRRTAERGFVGLGLHNTNRHDTIDGPAITVPPLQAKLADSRPSCRTAILDAVNRLHQRTGATEFARRDIVAEVQDTGAGFARQTIYRCLRRMTGREPGSAHLDLEGLGNDRLRLRA